MDRGNNEITFLEFILLVYLDEKSRLSLIIIHMIFAFIIFERL